MNKQEWQQEKYNKACQQFGSLNNPNPPMRIDWMTSVAWHILIERDYDIANNTVCLVYLHVENKIGIADKGVKGYTPTPCYIYPDVNGQLAVDWFNEHILGQSREESFHIFMSTFGG